MLAYWVFFLMKSDFSEQTNDKNSNGLGFANVFPNWMKTDSCTCHCSQPTAGAVRIEAEDKNPAFHRCSGGKGGPLE